MINLRTLETFYWVAQLGGFHRAAEKLHTTQPAVSARVAQLEQQLDTRLFERDKQGCHLTARGRQLLGYAERMLALRTEIVVAMTSPAELRGTVKLGVSETIVHTWLSHLLKRLHSQYPAITIEIDVDSSARLGDGLKDGRVDVALLLGPISAVNAINIPLCQYELSWVAAADFPLGAGPVTLPDLANLPIITFARDTKPYQQLASLFEKAGLHKVRMFANSSLSSIVRMTLDGIGVSAIPRHVIADQLAEGQLRLIESSDAMPSLAFTASYIERPDAPLSAVVAAIAAQAAEHYERREDK